MYRRYESISRSLLLSKAAKGVDTRSIKPLARMCIRGAIICSSQAVCSNSAPRNACNSTAELTSTEIAKRLNPCTFKPVSYFQEASVSWCVYRYSLYQARGMRCAPLPSPMGRRRSFPGTRYLCGTCCCSALFANKGRTHPTKLPAT